jgi:hypothetical protein
MNWNHPYIMTKQAFPWWMAKYVAAPAALLYGAKDLWSKTQRKHFSAWDNAYALKTDPTKFQRIENTVYHNPATTGWEGKTGTLRGYLKDFTPAEQKTLYDRGVTRYQHDFSGDKFPTNKAT